MIQEVTLLVENLFSSNVSTLLEEAKAELLEHAYPIAIRAARSFARKRNRQTDSQFVDECEAEALYVLTTTIYLDFTGIVEKWPDLENRRRFYFQLIGYSLKAYYSYWATSTASYLKKRGLEANPEWIENRDFPEANLEAVFDLWDHAIRTKSEERIVHLYIIHRDISTVANIVNRSEKKTAQILARVKKRIKGVL